VSGLLVQPLIGALADHSKSRLGRRRPFMVIGSILCAVSLLGLAWSTTVANVRFTSSRYSQNFAYKTLDSSPWYSYCYCLILLRRFHNQRWLVPDIMLQEVFTETLAPGLVMAADRALVVDILPRMVQQAANLWICRTTSFGSLIGFFIGHLKLGDLPIIKALGRTQLQILSALVSIGLISFHLIVSGLVKEKVLVKTTPRCV
jgi:solute carrier family 45, member 1/2/4